MIDILQVTPAVFGHRGLWGGGERYAVELARTQAQMLDTRLISFGPERREVRDRDFPITILPARFHWKGHELNAVSERLIDLIARSRVVHVHQYNTALTSLCLMAGAALRKPVFITDLGGSAPSWNRRLRLHRLVTGNLSCSSFALQFFPELVDRSTVIHGGVDTSRFRPPTNGAERLRQVCFVGRILPHKGIDVLIRAVDGSMPLHVYGRRYDEPYLAHLHELAAGKQVSFHHDAEDDEIVSALQCSRVAVLPSVYETYNGELAPKSEYFGLVLAEAMACGTPVVASRVGGMPEVVTEGVTGRIVEPGDAAALRAAIGDILDASESRWSAYSRACIDAVARDFTWTRVAERCIEAYGLMR